MSEFSKSAIKRVDSLYNYMVGIIKGDSGVELIKQNNILETNYFPTDIVTLFDKLFENNFTVEQMKAPSNKLFNLLHKTLEKEGEDIDKGDTFLYYMKLDNIRLEELLQSAKGAIRSVNEKYGINEIGELIKIFNDFKKIDSHYVLKENVLFPILEKRWREHKCVKLMWSFHDDIRKNIKKILELLLESTLDIKQFNSSVAKLYFDIYTIIFRENNVLFPIIKTTIEDEILDEMLFESRGLGFSFVKRKEILIENKNIDKMTDKSGENISLSTGTLTLNQLELIFSNLPVDMTYVDENNIVKYYSNPPHRIFPRTNAIIGREVQNCHPPESVDVVNRIVESFRSGEKKDASFWIQMGKKFILIRYFAIWDNQSVFRGTLEVSQEISDIKKLEGERRLLDWD